MADVRRAEIVVLHGKGYTERHIAAKLRCSNTTDTMLSPNSMLMARFMTRNVYAQGRLLNETNSTALAKEPL